MHTDTVNRKWLNRTYRTASRSGKYFTGSNTREIALGIVTAHDMHPSFVGKLDQLLAKLMAAGVYKLSEGRLVRCEPKPMPSTTARRRRRQMTVRAAKRGKQQYRDFTLSMMAEASAA